MGAIRTHEDLGLFQNAVNSAVLVFETCQRLPASERYELSQQWMRASRSVAANIAEAWRKRYYKQHFLSKLSDAEAEAAECQVWALFCFRFGYISEAESVGIRRDYDRILAQLVIMSRQTDKWTATRTRT